MPYPVPQQTAAVPDNRKLTDHPEDLTDHVVERTIVIDREVTQMLVCVLGVDRHDPRDLVLSRTVAFDDSLYEFVLTPADEQCQCPVGIGRFDGACTADIDGLNADAAILPNALDLLGGNAVVMSGIYRALYELFLVNGFFELLGGDEKVFLPVL